MKQNYQPKPKFLERIKQLLNSGQDFKEFLKIAKTRPLKSIRGNTLKIKPEKLITILKNKGWNISQPYPDYPEIIIINTILKPGELGKAKEHENGYYYIQEITSMMPIIALSPQSKDFFLDLCASPGSKTTQAAALMKNKGTIFANDMTRTRTSILSINIQRSGITNTIITKENGLNLIEKFKKLNLKFDKILLDTSCSGEGTIRTCPSTYQEWSESLIKSLSSKQKRLASNALSILKPTGILLYSTCTYAPEENEEVIDYLLKNHKDIDIQPIKLPLKTRQGITNWKNKKYNEKVKNCIRIYHQDNNMEGFFLCKIKKTGATTH